MAACVDCFNNCGGQIVTDKCVKYTGPDIDFLGISQGDPLSSLEAAIVSKLEGALDGTGITIDDLDSCTAIDNQLVGKDNTLVNILQALYTVVCTLRSDVDDVQSEIALPSSFDTSCLTLGANPTRDDILQAVITLLCTINTDVNTIKEDYVTTDTVCDVVADCASSTTQESSKMPKYCAIPYYGPLSVFDGSGAGLTAFGYKDVYLCVGQTVKGFVLPDMRGRVPVGSNIGMPGATLDSAVDPTLNPGYNISKGTKTGEVKHTLTTTEMPSHSHGVTDPGHNHSTSFGTDSSSGNNHANFAKLDASTVSKTSTTKTTGISINTAGGSQPHNIIQPSIGINFIMYVP